MLTLVGSPTLFPKLVGSRTYAERMFRIMVLDNLSTQDSREAIAKPLDKEPERIKTFFNALNDSIYNLTKGYPYFVRFWCRELYDYAADARPFFDKKGTGVIERISRKLDEDIKSLYRALHALSEARALSQKMITENLADLRNDFIEVKTALQTLHHTIFPFGAVAGIFSAQTLPARYCSNRCRQAARYARTKAKKAA